MALFLSSCALLSKYDGQEKILLSTISNSEKKEIESKGNIIKQIDLVNPYTHQIETCTFRIAKNSSKDKYEFVRIGEFVKHGLYVFKKSLLDTKYQYIDSLVVDSLGNFTSRVFYVADKTGTFYLKEKWLSEWKKGNLYQEFVVYSNGKTSMTGSLLVENHHLIMNDIDKNKISVGEAYWYNSDGEKTRFELYDSLGNLLKKEKYVN